MFIAVCNILMRFRACNCCRVALVNFLLDDDDDDDDDVTGSILRYVRDCTSLKLDGGESCKTNERDSQSLDAAAAASGKDRQSQQPARSCVWTCHWDGCNDAPLSSATRSQQPRRQLLQLVALSLVISVVIVTSSSSSSPV